VEEWGLSLLNARGKTRDLRKCLLSLSFAMTKPFSRFSHDSYVAMSTYRLKSTPIKNSLSILLISASSIPDTSDHVLFVYVLLLKSKSAEPPTNV